MSDNPPVTQMLLEAAQDSLEAFLLLRKALLDDRHSIELIDAHVNQLRFAISETEQAA